MEPFFSNQTTNQMLGLALLFFIGRSCYRLADGHQQNKWFWAIIVFYLGKVVLGVGLAFANPDFFSDEASSNDFGINLLGLGLGAIVVFGFYHLMKSQWEKKKAISNSDLLDDGF